MIQSGLERNADGKWGRSSQFAQINFGTATSGECPSSLVPAEVGAGVILVRSVRTRQPLVHKSPVISLFLKFNVTSGHVFSEKAKTSLFKQNRERMSNESSFCAASFNHNVCVVDVFRSESSLVSS